MSLMRYYDGVRTTVSIDDELLASARKVASSRGLTLGQLIEEALRLELAHQPRSSGPPIPVFRAGSGPRPGVDLDSNRALSEIFDEGFGLEQLR